MSQRGGEGGRTRPWEAYGRGKGQGGGTGYGGGGRGYGRGDEGGGGAGGYISGADSGRDLKVIEEKVRYHCYGNRQPDRQDNTVHSGEGKRRRYSGQRAQSDWQDQSGNRELGNRQECYQNGDYVDRQGNAGYRELRDGTGYRRNRDYEGRQGNCGYLQVGDGQEYGSNRDYEDRQGNSRYRGLGDGQKYRRNRDYEGRQAHSGNREQEDRSNYGNNKMDFSAGEVTESRRVVRVDEPSSERLHNDYEKSSHHSLGYYSGQRRRSRESYCNENYCDNWSQLNYGSKEDLVDSYGNGNQHSYRKDDNNRRRASFDKGTKN